MMVGYHGQNQTTPAIGEAALRRRSTTRQTSTSVTSGRATTRRRFRLSEQHHDRITHVHVKDVKMNHGPAVPFGEGDTPIKEVLRLIRDNTWKIQATVEFEYPMPQGSDRMAEIAKCVDYRRQYLLA
jgi:hypothetical protein